MTVTLSDAATGTTTTNGSGQFSFGNLQTGTYTLTPTLAGYVFNPSSITYTNLQKSWTNANFTALPPLQTTFNKNVNYAYNTVGALAGVGTNLLGTDATNTTNVINGLQFKAFGAIKQLNYGNGLQLTMGYNDTRQQPVTMKVGPNGTGSVINYTYEYYDGSGRNNNRIRGITDGVDGAYSVTYTYDQWNRLTNATAGAYSRQYLYDAFGNLKSVGGSGGPNPNYVLNYLANNTNAPLTNRILSVTENGQTQPFYYDNAGNLTQGDGMSYAYDAANRMVGVNGGALGQYGYDGEGMRVKKVEGGGTVWYVRSSKLGQVAMEVNSSGVSRAYVYDSGKHLLAQQSINGIFYWVHESDLGSGHKLTDANGMVRYRAEFDPHGQTVLEWSDVSSNLNTWKFTGYERDAATNLDYARARSFGSARGRFLQADPLGTKAVKPYQPQSLNRYSYVGNDPVNFTDRTGQLREATACFSRIIGVNESGVFYGNPVCGEILVGSDNNNGNGEGEPPRNPINEKLKKALDHLGEGCKKFFGTDNPDTLAKLKEQADAVKFMKSDSGNQITYMDGSPVGIDANFIGKKPQEDMGQLMRMLYLSHLEKTGMPQNYWTVLLGPRYFTATIGLDTPYALGSRNQLDAKDILLVHEFMHIINNMGDARLYSEWVKTGKLDAYATPINGVVNHSQAITDWISADCPPR